MTYINALNDLIDEIEKNEFEGIHETDIDEIFEGLEIEQFPDETSNLDK